MMAKDEGQAGTMVGAKTLFGMGLAELRELMVGLGEPKYRATQMFEGLYRQLAGSLEEMTVLPVALRERLTAR